MASDKRKGPTTKAQASAAKVTLKQRTLFDAFTVKNMPKTVSTQPSSQTVEVDDTPAATTTLSTGGTTVLPEQPNSTVFPLNSTFPPVEIVEAPFLDLTEDTNVQIHVIDKKDPMYRRSPSITIVEDDQVMDITDGIPVGRTPDQPIVIDSSPIKASSTTFKANKPLHPFFVSKSKPIAPSVRSSKSMKNSKAISVAQAPPYPTNVSQHVRGPQTLFQDTGLLFSRRASRQPERIPEEHASYGFLKRPDTVVDGPSEPSIYRTSDIPNEPSFCNIPEEHRSDHPAIARLVNDRPESSPISRRPWSEKWRPSCAQEVLGNEKSAVFLRNWLRALELQLEDNTGSSLLDTSKSDNVKGKSKASNRGTKRARIVRAAEKRRKRSRLDFDEDDNWIAYSDESENEEVNYEEIDNFGDIMPEVPASSQSSATHDIPPPSIDNKEQDLGQLHNTILLSGPSGSGKTACVYACAEELGWDVFEVYPGVGRRNGANVDNLIGEVGKNHLVLQNRPNSDALKLFLAPKKTGVASGDQDNPSMDDFIPSYSPRRKPSSKDTSDPGESATNTRPIRQSLILLEEVDILFKEDVNFWTTVTRIIKECKRPVICTCNDISLVPVDDLPLQSIIQFASCPVDVATSYLQALCFTEGYFVDRDRISNLYAHPLPDQQLLAISPSSHSPTPDLRRTINSLQIECSTFGDFHLQASHPGFGVSQTFGGEDLPISPSIAQLKKAPRTPMKKYEFFSYLDSNLVLDLSNAFMDAELAGCFPSEDDEIGHKILYDAYAKERPQFGRDDRHEDMIYTAIEIACRLFDVDVQKDNASRNAIEDQNRRVEQKTILQEVSPMAIWSRGNGKLCFDYLPYLRQMVEAEDLQEANELDKRPRVGRSTRNSARSGYVRTIELTEEARRKLESTGFNIVEGA